MNKVSYSAWGATVIWVGIVGYITFTKRADFSTMQLNAVGDFLAGTVSPLALIWLVAGYLQQGKELRLNTNALEAQLSELALQVKSTKDIAESNLLQANVAKSMHDFNVLESERAAEAKRLERLRSIRPDIYLKLSNRNAAQWVITAENIGGDAYRVIIDSKTFDRAVLFADTSRLASASRHRIELLDQRSGESDELLSLDCWDADDNHYVFYYRYDASRDLIISSHPYENGLLVRHPDEEYMKKV